MWLSSAYRFGAKPAGSSGRYLPLIKFRAIDIESLQSMIFLHNTEDVSVVPGGDLVAVNVLLHLRLCILIFNKGFSQNKTVLWIRIRMDPKLLPGSGIIVPDPAKYERADK